jgi:hypothetical protein
MHAAFGSDRVLAVSITDVSRDAVVEQVHAKFVIRLLGHCCRRKTRGGPASRAVAAAGAVIRRVSVATLSRWPPKSEPHLGAVENPTRDKILPHRL